MCEQFKSQMKLTQWSKLVGSLVLCPTNNHTNYNLSRLNAIINSCVTTYNPSPWVSHYKIYIGFVFKRSNMCAYFLGCKQMAHNLTNPVYL